MRVVGRKNELNVLSGSMRSRHRWMYDESRPRQGNSTSGVANRCNQALNAGPQVVLMVMPKIESI